MSVRSEIITEVIFIFVFCKTLFTFGGGGGGGGGGDCCHHICGILDNERVHKQKKEVVIQKTQKTLIFHCLFKEIINSKRYAGNKSKIPKRIPYFQEMNDQELSCLVRSKLPQTKVSYTRPMTSLLYRFTAAVFKTHLVGLVVKASVWRAAYPGFDSCFFFSDRVILATLSGS